MYVMKNTNFRLRTIEFIMIVIIAVYLLIPRMAICLDRTVTKTEFEGSSSLSIVNGYITEVFNAGGGNVYLPAGTSSRWVGHLQMGGRVNLIGAGSPSHPSYDGAMTTRGADGKLGPLPTTVIQYQVSVICIEVNIETNIDYTKPVRISGIRFVSWRDSTNPGSFMDIRSAKDLRIDHCQIEGSGHMISMSNPYGVTNSTNGVIDHCNFINPITLGGSDSLYYGVNTGSRTYVEDKPVGMAANGDAIYIEDCYFENPYHPVASMGGGHYVLRYSTIRDTYATSNGFSVDAHGPGFSFWPTKTLSSPYTAGGLTLNVASTTGFPDVASNSYVFIGSESKLITGKTSNTLTIASGLSNSYSAGTSVTTTRGGFVAEIYNNTISSLASRNPLNQNAIGLRAGKGIIFNNIFENHRHAVGIGNDPYTCTQGGLDHIWKTYIWNNTYTNIVPDTAGKNWINPGGCSSTYIHPASSCSETGKEVYGMKDGTYGDTGCPMPGYVPYTYPHPLVSGAPPPVSGENPSPPKNLRIINP